MAKINEGGLFYLLVAQHTFFFYNRAKSYRDTLIIILYIFGAYNH